MGTGNRSLLCYDYIIQDFRGRYCEANWSNLAQIEFYNLEFDSSPAVGSQAAAGGRGRQICNGFFENSSYSGSRVYISLLESWSTVGALSR